MKKILQFNRRYTKLPNALCSGSEVRLLEVFKTRFEDLHESFKEYDASSIDSGPYKLPEIGGALVLLFINHNDVFTTIRIHTPIKEHEYRRWRGSNFIVEIENEK